MFVFSFHQQLFDEVEQFFLFPIDVFTREKDEYGYNNEEIISTDLEKTEISSSSSFILY